MPRPELKTNKFYRDLHPQLKRPDRKALDMVFGLHGIRDPNLPGTAEELLDSVEHAKNVIIQVHVNVPGIRLTKVGANAHIANLDVLAANVKALKKEGKI